ncbi:MAG: hypothetical protein DWQ07_23970 [Chloroflexi bacterium]|nr:MAG: hypothetical protein DWQ07_23970 [Chloroflexota bacterium]MBL1194206.1 hypothetical protein [Chloroflexota bacterium]NOH11499.1 hypothetical protein [Chloroflexota bacterium]
MDKTLVGLVINRFLLVLLVSLLLVVAISELGFRLQVLSGDTDRLPQDVVLVIPEGTAERVAQGEEVPAIPEEMTFVVGDVLVVRNEDSVGHELGPVLVAPGGTASLPMEQAEHFALACSFQPSRYLGLEVREASTLSVRILAIVYAVPPTLVMFFIYSLAIWPLRRDDQAPPANPAQA